jgi:hypothetical protein
MEVESEDLKKVLECVKHGLGDQMVDAYWVDSTTKPNSGRLIVVLESEPADMNQMYHDVRSALEELHGVADLNLELTLTTIEKTMTEPFVKNTIKKARVLTSGRH